VANLQTPGHVVQKVILLALLGFGVVMLGGPILALVSVVLSFGLVILFFALVGFVVWSLIQFVFFGNRMAWEAIPEAARRLGQAWLGGARKFGQVLGVPLRFVSRIGGGLLAGAGFAWKKSWAAAWTVGEIALVALSGVLVGVLVGVVTGAPNNHQVTVPTNALLGGAIAAVAGIAMTVRERRTRVQTQGVSCSAGAAGTT
jgi:hypothetical protein